MDKMEIYNRLPIPLQNLACFFEGERIKHTRYNKEFESTLKLYEDRENWSYDKICYYRDKQLQNMVEYAYDNVLYYRHLFDYEGIDCKTIRRIDDLRKIPILTKQIIKQNPENFVSIKYPKKKLINFHTSGTTGSGFKFYSTLETIHNQWASFWRAWENLGITRNMLCGQFASRLIVPSMQKSPPFWRFNYPGKQIYFSAFHESEENLKFYYEVLQRKKVEWIHGYPSLLTPLASFIIKNKLDHTLSIRFITTGAENLMQYQKKIIEQAFGVIPTELYGQSENVAIFTERCDGKIHVEDDFSAVEFIPEKDNHYKIVGTSLYNYAMPLLRYDTKDMVAGLSYDSSADRRIVEEIDGRCEDYIYLPSGRKIGKLDHVFKDTIHFSEVQVYQRKDYSITVYVVRMGNRWKEDEMAARKLLIESIGNEINIDFRYVDKLEKTKGGKTRFVISEIND